MLFSCNPNKKTVSNVENNKSDSLRNREMVKEDSTINQLDKNGLKNGFWIENEPLLTEVYYRNGKKNGLFRSYHNNGKLYGFGEYKNDIQVGTWYCFDDSSKLEYIEKEIEYNPSAKYVTKNDETFKPIFKSYLIIFYPNGQVKEDGYIIYDEDLQISYTEIGKWEYYDENGKLVSTKDFGFPSPL
jgi:antitoxin component YwqK of YwqJK toxin-antitoxin module